MSKKAALLALAAIMTATPAAAQGYLGLEYGNDSLDLLGGSGDADIWQGEGAVGFGATGWGGQVGGSIGSLDLEGTDADTWTLNGHLFWSGAGWRIGGVAATTQVDFGSSGDIGETQFGVEAMWAPSANGNIYADYLTGDVDDNAILGDADVWNFDVGGNYYFSPNVRVGANIGTGNLDFGGGADFNTLSAGINGEFQPWSAPISITLGWNHFDVDDIDTTGDTFQIGARWNFGGGTLQDRDGKLPFNTYTGFYNRLLGVY